VTLKSRVGVIEDHWKWHHSNDGRICKCSLPSLCRALQIFCLLFVNRIY